MEENRKRESIYEILAKEIKASGSITDEEKTKQLSRLMKVKAKPVNILLVGPTAAGKSSTINALFDMEKAKVGMGVDPETSEITRYDVENLRLFDTPGLGDSPDKDKKYMLMIRDKLTELDKNGDPLIDLVLVIIDSSQKDLGTVYECINRVIVPILGKEAEKRILIALNKADIAMSGRHWNETLNCPDEVLTAFLDKKAESVQHRIAESTGITFKPVCYAAGFKEEGSEQQPYNVIKLLYTITAAIPKEKRLALVDILNPDPEMWRISDGKRDYKTETKKNFWEAIADWIGETIGSVKAFFSRIIDRILAK